MEAKYKRNPAPKQPYQIVLKIEGAPGPFAKIEGFASYEATECTYTPDPIAGVPLKPGSDIPMEFSKVDESTYTATIYADAMLDEDYLGRGVCHWGLMSVNTWVKATGAKTDISYVATLWSDDLIAQKARTNYYVKYAYPGSDPDEFSDHGEVDRSKYKPEFQDQLFTINLTPKAGMP
ncbi:hypothetical protein GLA29479_2529 [Lysobacter antibioticus]|nr:hypothetical protein GLA29479_2529 [Lysobacter antibioticus]